MSENAKLTIVFFIALGLGLLPLGTAGDIVCLIASALGACLVWARIKSLQKLASADIARKD